jgi:NAD(P) transhydrogenase subunit alpha
MYANNLFNLVSEFWSEQENAFTLDVADEVQAGCIITHQGEVVNAMVKSIYQSNNTASNKEGAK